CCAPRVKACTTVRRSVVESSCDIGSSTPIPHPRHPSPPRASRSARPTKGGAAILDPPSHTRRAMTAITVHADHATLINVFTVEPDHARQLADLLTTATEEVMRHIDGFISANIHVSTDGTRVVNYAQWRDAE